MKLYKYVSPERIDIILNAQIRFSQAEVWNDPFELQPCFQDHIEKNPIKQLYEFAKIVNDYETNDTVPVKEQIDKYEKERKRITKDDIYRYLNKKIVALSLTEERENLLMWSHYASNHTGLIIELDTNTAFFNHNDRHLHKTDYGIDRPKVKTNEFATLMVELVNLINEKKEISKTLLEELSKGFKKGLDWSYEKEWRLITLTENANNFKSFEQDLNRLYIGSNHYDKLYIALFPLPLETITTIYIGKRASNSLKRKLYLLTKYNPLYSYIKLLNTKIDDNEFKLNFKEVQDTDVLKIGELKIDINKITKWQRFSNTYINSYYKEIENIKKVRPAANNS